jgi:hypothetical protein
LEVVRWRPLLERLAEHLEDMAPELGDSSKKHTPRCASDPSLNLGTPPPITLTSDTVC